MSEHQKPGLFALLQRLARTGSGAIHNRFELFSIEWQQERARLTALLVWTAALLFTAMMAMVMLTALVLLALPQDYRAYGAAFFIVLYLVGAFLTWKRLAAVIRQDPFPETLRQLKQDGQWVDSFTTRN